MAAGARELVLLCGAAAAAVGASAGRAGVPAPADLPAEVIVSGRTSTAVDVKIVPVGESIPETFSRRQVGNTPGFSWWVSRHYALKTDLAAADARHYLTVLELAYPHYVELFGREIPGIGRRRMAAVYASDRAQLDRAMRTDGLRADFDGGGITFDELNCAYVYPSGTLRYHRRYILLHECTHAYQVCLNGTCDTTAAWYYEGIADLFGSHVYQADKRRLTVNVLDKAPALNFYGQGLAECRRRPVSFSRVHELAEAGRGISFLLAGYFATDPDRAHRLRIWRDEMFRRGLHGPKQRAASAEVLQRLFGPWNRIDADLAAWIAQRRNTFHDAVGGWEQDGDTLWSCGRAEDGGLSRADVLLPPGQEVRPDPLRMDYPPSSDAGGLVGPVRRGTAEPVVGCVVDFSRSEGKGAAGMGLGAVDGPAGAPELSTDRAGKLKGVNVAAHTLAGIVRRAGKVVGVKAGRLIGNCVDPRIEMGLRGSITQAAGPTFVVEWTGFLQVAQDSAYEFTVDSGGWCRLWIDDEVVLAGGGPGRAMGRADLWRGGRALRLRYAHEAGQARIRLLARPDPPPGLVKVLIDSMQRLVIDGAQLGIAPKTAAIPEALRAAAGAGGNRVGMTVRVADDALCVTLRARDPKAAGPVAFDASVPIDAGRRRRLLSRPLCVLSRGGRHGVTPLFDEGRPAGPDLSAAAPAMSEMAACWHGLLRSSRLSTCIPRPLPIPPERRCSTRSASAIRTTARNTRRRRAAFLSGPS